MPGLPDEVRNCRHHALPRVRPQFRLTMQRLVAVAATLRLATLQLATMALGTGPLGKTGPLGTGSLGTMALASMVLASFAYGQSISVAPSPKHCGSNSIMMTASASGSTAN